jgi:hypothetical protein
LYFFQVTSRKMYYEFDIYFLEKTFAIIY